MNIAWCTPFGRGNAIGHAGSLVIEELRRLTNVDIWHPSTAEPIDTPVQRVVLCGSPADAARLATYDLAIYNMGNHVENHRQIFEASRQVPGIVVLHDWVLQPFFQAYYSTQGLEKSYFSAMQRWYGPKAEAAVRSASPDLTDLPEASMLLDFPLFEEAIAGAYAVITHSDFSAKRVRAVFPGPVRSVPFPYSRSAERAARGRSFRLRDGQILAVTIGDINPARRIASVLEVLRRNPYLASRVVYAVIGNIESAYERELEVLVQQAGLQQSVRLMGHLPHESLHGYLAAADFCIYLSYPARETASPSAIDQLFHGKPLIVSRAGSYEEIPDDCALKVGTDCEIVDLTTSIQRLAGDVRLRKQMADCAKAYARSTFRADRYARQVAALSEEVIDAKPMLAFTDHIGKELVRMAASADLPIVSTVAAASSALFGSRAVNRPGQVSCTIAVDLTPVLPGGRNGGSKIVALGLVPLLADIAPQSRFILLTTSSNHELLASMDGHNVERFCIDVPHRARGAVTNAALKVHSAIRGSVPRAVLDRLAAVYRRAEKARGERSLLERLGAEVLFCPFTAPYYADGRTPFVSIVADLQWYYLPEFFSSEERSRFLSDFQHVAHNASRIVCISHYVRETVVRAGAPLDRTSVIYHAFHHRLPDPATPSLSKWGLSSGQFLFYPANFWRHKNHANLIQGFAKFIRDNPVSDIKLVLSGAGGTEREAILNNVHALDLDNRVLVPGYVSDAELSRLLSGSLALIFPSLFEGFGMPVLEAMAAGVPVVCSNVTSLPEIVGDAALMIDPRDPAAIATAISRVAGDASLRQALIEAGHRRVAAFDNPRQMAERYWREICEAAHTRPASRICS